MHTKLAVFSVFLLFTMMVFPAYADVTSVKLEKSFYTKDESFKLVGTQDDRDTVFVIIYDPTGEFAGMLSDPNPDIGKFSVIPRSVSTFFKIEGIYNATAFTDDQKRENGTSILLEFNGDQVFEVPTFVLELNTISDKTIEEKKTLTFTPTLSEKVDGAVFSLEKNPPSGATIDANTGKFIWTPTTSQGPASYTFDIVVKKGALEDRQTIKVTVTEKAEPTPTPTPTPTPEPEPEVNEEPKELGLAPFVDASKDPQSYVDRYNNEPSYKKWFDDNYPQYSSIYQAVGLDEPKELAAFVDPNQDPQYYINRYNNEPKYKDWFDKTYPDITIYDAVGLDEPEVKQPEIGECGEGTKLVDGKCTIIEKQEKQKEGGGCLIATAAYGSEMAPQVQFLREIRDNKVMSTESGVSFMQGFNEFYYTFSPYVADYERENPVFKEMVKIGITPMLSSLSIMSFADSDEEIVGYGIGVILMNIGMYIAAPAMMFYGIRKARKVKF